MEENKTIVWFAIYDFDCSPTELTGRLGLQPSEMWLKGDLKPFGKSGVKVKQNTWKLKSSLSSQEPVEKHLAFLINQLKPIKSELNKITSKYYAEFGCAIYFMENNPGIHIDKNIIKEIAKLDAELDLDMYTHRIK